MLKGNFADLQMHLYHYNVGSAVHANEQCLLPAPRAPCKTHRLGRLLPVPGLLSNERGAQKGCGLWFRIKKFGAGHAHSVVH